MFVSLMLSMLFGHSANPESDFWIVVLWVFNAYIVATLIYTVVGTLPIKEADPWHFIDFLLFGFITYYLVNTKSQTTIVD